MLRVIGTAPGIKPLESRADEYVPLHVEWEPTGSSSPLYWRTGDLTSSMLSVGLNPNSGTVRSVTLTMAGARVQHIPAPEPDGEIAVRLTHPMCDLAGWPEDGFRDEPMPFDIYVYEDSVRVNFIPGVPADVLDSGPVRFHLDEGRALIGISVRLPQPSQTQMIATITWQRATAGFQVAGDLARAFQRPGEFGR